MEDIAGSKPTDRKWNKWRRNYFSALDLEISSGLPVCCNVFLVETVPISWVDFPEPHQAPATKPDPVPEPKMETGINLENSETNSIRLGPDENRGNPKGKMGVRSRNRGSDNGKFGSEQVSARKNLDTA